MSHYCTRSIFCAHPKGHENRRFADGFAESGGNDSVSGGAANRRFGLQCRDLMLHLRCTYRAKIQMRCVRYIVRRCVTVRRDGKSGGQRFAIARESAQSSHLVTIPVYGRGGVGRLADKQRSRVTKVSFSKARRSMCDGPERSSHIVLRAGVVPETQVATCTGCAR